MSGCGWEEGMHIFITGSLVVLTRCLFLSSGLMHEDLQAFLVNNIPQGKKKSKVTLGVSDPKLGSVIYETLNIHCQTGEHV